MLCFSSNGSVLENLSYNDAVKDFSLFLLTSAYLLVPFSLFSHLSLYCDNYSGLDFSSFYALSVDGRSSTTFSWVKLFEFNILALSCPFTV